MTVSRITQHDVRSTATLSTLLVGSVGKVGTCDADQRRKSQGVKLRCRQDYACVKVAGLTKSHGDGTAVVADVHEGSETFVVQGVTARLVVSTVVIIPIVATMVCVSSVDRVAVARKGTVKSRAVMSEPIIPAGIGLVFRRSEGRNEVAISLLAGGQNVFVLGILTIFTTLIAA